MKKRNQRIPLLQARKQLNQICSGLGSAFYYNIRKGAFVAFKKRHLFLHDWIIEGFSWQDAKVGKNQWCDIYKMIVQITVD